MHFTADTENGDYLDDPSEDQIRDLIAALGRDAGTFITFTPASEHRNWYASVSLLPDGTTEINRGDPSRSEQHTAAATTSPASIARDLTTWIAARD